MEEFRDICSRVKFQNIGDEREDQRGGGGSPWCVAWSSLYRAKHVTRSKLVEGKLSKSGKNFDKVSGLLFFGQKKKV